MRELATPQPPKQPRKIAPDFSEVQTPDKVETATLQPDSEGVFQSSESDKPAKGRNRGGMMFDCPKCHKEAGFKPTDSPERRNLTPKGKEAEGICKNCGKKSKALESEVFRIGKTGDRVPAYPTEG